MKNLHVTTEKRLKIEKRRIHSLVNLLCKELNISLENLDINFVSEKTITEINKSYLKHNYPTDIITFNYSGNHDLVDGEIFICIKVALENALKYKVDLDSEIIRLVVHGILHIVGYDDVYAKDRKKMKIREDILVNLFEIDFKNLIIEYDSEDS